RQLASAPRRRSSRHWTPRKEVYVPAAEWTRADDWRGRRTEHRRRLDAQESLADQIALQQIARDSFRDHAACLKHVAAMRVRRCGPHVLLDDQDGDPALVDLAQGLEDPGHELGRDADGRL